MRCCKKTPDCQAGATILELALLVDRYLLIVSTFCFFAAIVRTILSLRARVFQPGRFSFLAIGLGFIFQTAFVAGISRFDFDHRLWGVRARLHCRRDVSRAGAPA